MHPVSTYLVLARNPRDCDIAFPSLRHRDHWGLLPRHRHKFVFCILRLGILSPSDLFGAGKTPYLPRYVAPESESRQGSPPVLFHIWQTPALCGHTGSLWGCFWGLSGSLRDSVRVVFLFKNDSGLRVEFFLKNDSGYPRDAEVTLFTLANLGSSFALRVCNSKRKKSKTDLNSCPRARWMCSLGKVVPGNWSELPSACRERKVCI